MAAVKEKIYAGLFEIRLYNDDIRAIIRAVGDIFRHNFFFVGYAIKPMYEKKYRELIRDSSKFTSINDLRLSIDNVKGAIHYLREIYRHKISKTRVISLTPPLEVRPGGPDLPSMDKPEEMSPMGTGKKRKHR